jgi:hypothetical protein
MWSSFKFGNINLSLLPPEASTASTLPPGLTAFLSSPSLHEARLADIQRFRGRVYFQDGAIPKEALDEEGRHRLESDPQCWHLSMSDTVGAIRGCLRLRPVYPSIDLTQLEVNRVLARMEPASRDRFLRVMEQYSRQALADGLDFGEVGGLAVAEELKQSSAALILVVAGWAVARLLGGMIGVATPTVRHNSAKMLQRIGAFPFCGVDGILAPYYDPYYRCEIQMLAFDSRKLAPEFEPLAEQIRLQLLLRHRE